MQKIGIIDYEMGNLHSVKKALELMGASVYTGNDKKKLEKMDKLIVPGVGAFGNAIRQLKERDLIYFIREAAQKNRIILGICLGLQLFFEKSAENKNVNGIGLWEGSVVRFKQNEKKTLKIPQMGWNTIRIKQKTPLLKNVPDESYFYFVHSYFAKPKDKNLIIGSTEYGTEFPSILGRDNIFAVQFHPEKSQKTGLQILKNFIHI